MKRGAISRIARTFGLAMVITGFAISVPNQASAQGSGAKVPCTVNYLRLRIATGGDDLRGWDKMSTSKDNLDVTVYFGEQGSQLAANVNKNERWQNNSVHLVEIKLNQAVPLEQIKGIKLEHTGSSGGSYDVATGSTPIGPVAGIQSPDTWDMQSLEVTAVGGGVGANILRHGPKIFTNGDRVLSTRVQIPANSCEVGERFGKLNPGARTSTLSQKTPSPTTTPRLTNPTPTSAPMLGTPGQPLLAHGGTPAALLAQAPRTTNATMASGGPATTPAARATVTPAKVTPPSGGPQTGPAAIPSKGHEKNGYEAVTTQRGATSDPNFTKWTNPANRYTVPPNATNICLNKAFIQSVNGKAAPQIPFVGGSDGEGTVIGGVVSASITFTPGNHYIISGCGFGTIAGKVYLLGQFPAHGGKIMLEPYHASATSLRSLSWGSQWSDRQIDAQIDPSLSGEVSQPGIALIIETSTGAKLQAFGFSFSP